MGEQKSFKMKPFIETSYFHIAEQPMDAALHSFDLTETIDKIKCNKNWKMGELTSIILLKTDFMSIVLIALDAQSEIKFKQSSNSMSVQILEGLMSFQIEEQSVLLKIGSLITMQEMTQHTVIALENSIFLLTVSIYPNTHD